MQDSDRIIRWPTEDRRPIARSAVSRSAQCGLRGARSFAVDVVGADGGGVPYVSSAEGVGIVPGYPRGNGSDLSHERPPSARWAATSHRGPRSSKPASSKIER